MCQPLTAEGEFALVREHLEIALLQPSVGWIAFGDHELYNLLVDIAAQQRDEATIQKYTPLAEEFASRYDHKLYQAVAHRAWGVMNRLAGQYAESHLRFDRALEIFQNLDTRYQIGRTLFEWGKLAATQKEHATARDHFTRALNDFERIGAAPDAIRVRERLAAL